MGRDRYDKGATPLNIEEKVLEIKELTFGFGKHKLYRDFSLTIKRGECAVLVGPSGSGKSTLLELIAGNLKMEKGYIGHGRISWIFQDPYSSFHHSYTIESQIYEVMTADNFDKNIKQLKLEPSLLKRYPHELSGGQLQRCSILRALAMEPELLLCDEPTSALDNVTQLETMRLLISLLDRMGLLLITHDMDLAHWAADKIIKLEN